MAILDPFIASKLNAIEEIIITRVHTFMCIFGLQDDKLLLYSVLLITYELYIEQSFKLFLFASLYCESNTYL